MVGKGKDGLFSYFGDIRDTLMFKSHEKVHFAAYVTFKGSELVPGRKIATNSTENKKYTVPPL